MLLVHTSSYSDKLRLAEHGVGYALDILHNNVNVVEIVDNSDKICRSYTGLHDANRLVTKCRGFLFEQTIVPKLKPYLDGTQDIIFAGGNARNCLMFSIFSILAAKTFGESPTITDLFKEYDPYHVWAVDMIKKGRSMIDNGPKLRLHLIADAIYCNIIDVRQYGKDLIQNNITANMILLPKLYRQLLEQCGLNIYEYVDGLQSPGMISKGKDGSIIVELHYWPNSERVAEFLTDN